MGNWIRLDERPYEKMHCLYNKEISATTLISLLFLKQIQKEGIH